MGTLITYLVYAKSFLGILGDVFPALNVGRGESPLLVFPLILVQQKTPPNPTTG